MHWRLCVEGISLESDDMCLTVMGEEHRKDGAPEPQQDCRRIGHIPSNARHKIESDSLDREQARTTCVKRAKGEIGFDSELKNQRGKRQWNPMQFEMILFNDNFCDPWIE
jgi:hypothetical protein